MPQSPADVSGTPLERVSARAYIVGNGAALAFGLLACFAALLWTGAVNLKGWDFFYYYAPSRLIVEGHGALIYNTAALGHLERAMTYPFRVPNGVVPNVYPPYFALLLAPLAALPYNVAYVVWLCLNCFLLAAGTFVFEPLARLGPRRALYVRFAFFCSLPVVVALLQGQTSCLTLALLALVYLALRSERDTLASGALAIAMIKPQYVLPFLLLLLIQRRWRALASFAVASLLLLALPAAILGLSVDAQYLDTLRHAAGWGSNMGGFAPVWNRSFAGFAQLLLPQPASTVVTGVLDLAALALFIRALLRGARLDLAFGLALVVALLVSQHVLIHDLTLLIIPVAIALEYRAVGPRHLVLLLVAVYVLVTVGFGLALFTPVQSATVGMTALGVWLYVAIGREAADPASALPVLLHGDPAERARADSRFTVQQT